MTIETQTEVTINSTSNIIKTNGQKETAGGSAWTINTTHTTC